MFQTFHDELNLFKLMHTSKLLKVFSRKILYCHEQTVITNKLHHEYVICFNSHKPCRVFKINSFNKPILLK